MPLTVVKVRDMKSIVWKRQLGISKGRVYELCQFTDWYDIRFCSCLVET